MQLLSCLFSEAETETQIQIQKCTQCDIAYNSLNLRWGLWFLPEHQFWFMGVPRTEPGTFGASDMKIFLYSHYINSPVQQAGFQMMHILQCKGNINY